MSAVLGFDLDGFLTYERARVETALERSLARLRARLGRSDLADVVEAGVRSGGKRLRPILAVAAYRAVLPEGDPRSSGEGPSEGRPARDGAPAAGSSGEATGIPEALYDLSISLELIHAYSLMHDDLPCMDDAPLRRGRPTPHTVFGVRAATRAAALLIPWAGSEVWESSRRLGLPDDVSREILRVLMDAAGARGMVGGQVVDLESEGLQLDEVGLTRLHGMKTGALLAAALEIGALAGRAPSSQRGALLAYGRGLGLAFQIADDVLDRTGSTEALGKAPSDEGFDKSTFVALMGVEGARARGAAVVSEAVAELRRAQVDSAPLEGLADYILRRDH